MSHETELARAIAKKLPVADHRLQPRLERAAVLFAADAELRRERLERERLAGTLHRRGNLVATRYLVLVAALVLAAVLGAAHAKPRAWRVQYRFTLTPRQFAEYEAMCHYQQTSPHSHFTQKRICTLARPDGRITLSDLRLIRTTNGQREERELADEAAYQAALREYFGIELSEKPHDGKSFSILGFVADKPLQKT